MSDYVFAFDEAGYREVFQSLTGPVGRDLQRRCRTLEVLAMANCGFDTGALVASIDSAFFLDHGGDLEARVGANPGGDEIGYGYFHHMGTKAHPIFPRTAKMLRFPDRRPGAPKGAVVYRQSVWHPGTSPNRYLTNFLGEVI